MNQDNKPDRQPITLFIFIAFLLLWFFYSLYKHWKGIIEPENGYNGIDSVVGMGGMLLNAITIYFVYISYKQQNKQIEKNDRDTEFNRILDVFYRQLDLSLSQFDIDNTKLLAAKEELINSGTMETVIKNFDVLTKAVSTLKKVENFYTGLLQRSNLNDKDKAYLFNIYDSNFPQEYKTIAKLISDCDELNLDTKYKVEEFKRAYTKEYFVSEDFIGDRAIENEITLKMQSKKRELLKIYYQCVQCRNDSRNLSDNRIDLRISYKFSDNQ
ncbi:hypothetical protein PQ465_08540 [Sphingobacterium oryzagri]|uniref:Phage abortive infection protein n=1 Tax=Sphingobacterium oryzagri TaxID=3025669 RepID=A0ABY7WN20_9SPHI|nr:hypothetical protein [Sphingobacterium sp. KACC 22765]WDF70410.1 hypothetical protein PQ465_08540 [Sphingobacterium sp. KACC 22765]